MNDRGISMKKKNKFHDLDIFFGSPQFSIAVFVFVMAYGAYLALFYISSNLAIRSSTDSSPLSTVQHECIPQALLGMDVICQAKAGMGKTAVFVLATLHQLNPVAGEVHVVVLCHTRELAFQIQKEYERFSKYLPDVKSRVFFGGVNVKTDMEALKVEMPHVVVGKSV